jgi:hypothetical protein
MLLVLKRLRKLKIDPDEFSDDISGEDTLDADITPEGTGTGTQPETKADTPAGDGDDPEDNDGPDTPETVVDDGDDPDKDEDEIPDFDGSRSQD